VPFLALSDRDRLLVHAAVGPGPTAADAWTTWFAGVVLDDIPYPEARLLPQVFYNLNRQGRGESLPPRMRGKYRWVWASNQLRAGVVAPVLEALEAAGIRTMLLKGAALVAGDRRAGGAREMGDVDVLVPTAQAGDAAALLGAGGWSGQRGVTPQYLAERLVNRRHSWNFDGGESTSIDLHWHAFEDVGGLDADRLLWEGARATTLGGVGTARLDDSAQLVQTLVHAALAEDVQRLEWLVDVASLLEHVDEARVVRVTRMMGVRDAVGEGLELAGSVLGSERAARLARRVMSARRTLRSRILAPSSRPEGSTTPAPRVRELLRTSAVQTRGVRNPIAATKAVLRRRVEPALVARRALSTGLALAGHPRRAEVLALRFFGPITRAGDGSFPIGEWVSVTPALLDGIGGPGWSMPEPDEGGVWTDGAEARLSLDLDAPKGTAFVLHFDFGPEAWRTPNAYVEARVNGRALQTWLLAEGHDHAHGPWHVDVPAWLADWCRPLEVVLRSRRPFDPSSRNGAPGDVRAFVHVRALRVCCSDEAA
jgi:hypothetical protein